MGRVSTAAVFLFFRMGFYFVTTGWISDIGLCENSIKSNQSMLVILVSLLISPNSGRCEVRDKVDAACPAPAGDSTQFDRDTEIHVCRY